MGLAGDEVRLPSRTDIIRALEDMSAYEGGFSFQALAVILGKKRWPRLIASEWKNDLGRDAYTPAADGGPAIALAGSLSADLGKIKGDLSRIRETWSSIDVLVFCTPQKVTNQTAEKWQKELAESGDDVQLIVVSREDIITTLLLPENADLCRTHLKLSIPTAPEVEQRLDEAVAACLENVDKWLRHPRLRGKPLIELNLATRPAHEETRELLDLDDLERRLALGERVLLTAPGGGGKTTTAALLAKKLCEQQRLCFLIDAPQWIASGGSALEVVCHSQAFLSRGLSVSEVARLAESHHVDWVVNGWNEIAHEGKARASARLRELDRDFPGAGVLVATRAGLSAPPLPAGIRVDVQPVTGEQRESYLRAELGEDATALIELIGRSDSLDSLTRVPLVLAEVAELHGSGTPIPKSTFGVLAAMTDRVEESEQHSVPLGAPPLDGLARSYLVGLAMTATERGEVLIPDAEARAAVSHVADTLVMRGQLSERPDPGRLVEALCAHHSLERVADSENSVRFQHQRLQEFYTALAILDLISDSSGPPSGGPPTALQTDVLNRPAFAAPTELLGEAVGVGEPALGSADTRSKIGERIVLEAFEVDPLHAASLARLCGDIVWEQIGGRLGDQFRKWYMDDQSEELQRYALAAMLATAAPDFADILEPLFTADDDQIRFGAYRALGRFYPTCLGVDWRRRISNWKEQNRVQLVTETQWLESVEVAEHLLVSDPSETVQGAAVDALLNMSADEFLERHAEVVTDGVLKSALGFGSDPTWFPEALRDRAIASAIADEDQGTSLVQRVRRLTLIATSGDEGAISALKAELDAVTPEETRQLASSNLGEAISHLRLVDSDWIDQWLIERILDGSLRPLHWVDKVTALPAGVAKRLIEQVTSDPDAGSPHGTAVALLRRFADPEIAKTLINALLLLDDSGNPDAVGSDSQKKRGRLRDNVLDLCRSIEPDALAPAILAPTSGRSTELQLVALSILGSIGETGAELGQQISSNHREQIRQLLLDMESEVLDREEYNGETKAELALALGRLGHPDDAAVLKRLIDADIERVRAGREARVAGRRDPMADGATMSWARWYVLAVTWLGEEAAVPMLLDLLAEPEYQIDAAEALVTRVLQVVPADRQPFLRLGEDEAWDRARSPDDELWGVVADAIASRIRTLVDIDDDEPGSQLAVHGTKELTALLAVLDRGDYTDLIFRVLEQPEPWDVGHRTTTLERMSDSLGRLPTEPTIRVVDSIFSRIAEIGWYNQQYAYLPPRLLVVLATVESTKVGVAKIGEAIEMYPIPSHELPEVIAALGRTGSDEALTLLVNVLQDEKHGADRLRRASLRALALIDTPRSREALLSFMGIGAGEPALEPASGDGNVLEQELARLSEDDPEIAGRLEGLCTSNPDPIRRSLLARIMSRRGTEDALIQGLSLIDDDANPPVPHPLESGLRDLLLQRRPHPDFSGAETIAPTAGGAIRRRLLEFWLADEGRRDGSRHLLQKIDDWRLDYGKPLSEPRHPAIDLGAAWPPRSDSS